MMKISSGFNYFSWSPGMNHRMNVPSSLRGLFRLNPKKMTPKHPRIVSVDKSGSRTIEIQEVSSSPPTDHPGWARVEADPAVEKVYSASVVPASLWALILSRYHVSMRRSRIRYFSWSPEMGEGRACHSRFRSLRYWMMKYLTGHPPDCHSFSERRADEPLLFKNDPWAGAMGTVVRAREDKRAKGPSFHMIIIIMTVLTETTFRKRLERTNVTWERDRQRRKRRNLLYFRTVIIVVME